MAKFSHVQFPNGDIHDVVGTDVVDQQNIKSGSLVNFSTNVSLPLTALSSTIVATQAGTGTPSPSNPRSISGFSSVKFVQTSGDVEFAPFFRGVLQGTYGFVDLGTLNWNYYSSQNRFAAQLSDGKYTGTITGLTGAVCSKYQISTSRFENLADKQMSVGSNFFSSSICAVVVHDENYTDKTAFTSAVTGQYLIYRLATPQTPTITPEQFATLCTAFGITGDTFTIALGQTVYGGSVDAKSGKATITHVCEELGSLTWGSGTGGSARFVAIPTYTAKAPSAATTQADVISDIFKTVSSKTIYDGTDDYEIAIHTNGSIWVRDTDYSDKDAFKTAMANHYVCYELATPIEITGLTPANFTTIAGENNIFSDCGEVTVKYFAGTNVNKAIDDISELKINAHHDAFDELTDTNISSPSNGQIVKYNGTKWVNADNSANGVAVDGTTMQIQNTTVQKFLDILYDALKDTTVELTASGSIANFTTSLVKPLVGLSSTIVAQQSGGTPTPSSPLPISGFSSVSFTQQDSESTTVDSFIIQLGQTVYGGSVDAKSGKASKTVKYFSFSEAQYYGTYGADNANLYYVEIPDYTTEKIKQYTGTTSPDCILISNMFEKNMSTSSRMPDNQFRTNTGAAPQYFYFRADGFADLTALNAFLANTPLQVVAELQTPVEITGLTPDNFTTFAGEQNIFADSGDISVSFKQGIQEYIDAKIAETQA